MKKIIMYVIFLFLLSSFVSSADLTTNNVAYYSLDNDSLTGHNYNDISANSNKMTEYGCTTGVVGLIDEACDFEESESDYGRINSTADFNFGTGNFSVSMWAKVETDQTENFLISYTDSTNADEGWYIRLDSGAHDITIWLGDPSDADYQYRYCDSGTNPVCDIKDGNYHHLVFVRQGLTSADMLIYIDGIEASTGGGESGTTNVYSAAFHTIVGAEFSNLNFYDGIIDELSLWDKALNQSEITSLNNSGNGYNFYASGLTPFQITAKSIWNSTAINTFNATISGTTYATTNGTIITPYNNSQDFVFNITINSSDWFTEIIEHNISSNLDQSLKQSIINFTCSELLSNNVLTCLNSTIYPNAYTHNFSISVTNYYNIIQEETILALDNKTINITGFYNSILNITANTTLGATINQFNISYERLDGDYTHIGYLNTTTGYVEFNTLNGTYNIEIDAAGYEIKNDNTTININSNNYTFVLYTTNSISFIFKDEITKNTLTSTNITIELISDAYSNNYSTTNGTLYVDLLSPDIYTMRYEGGASYPERFYYFTLNNRTHTTITLYLLNNGENITATVYDQYNNFVEDAYIKVLRYDLLTNTYILREIVKTNFEGQTKFLAELETEYYKFIIETPLGTIVKETSPTYLYTNSIVLKINIGTVVGTNFDNFQDISYSLDFNNATNNFRFTYSDAQNTLSEACIYVYKIGITGNTLQNTSCSSSSASTILINVDGTTGNKFIAKTYATLDGEENFLTQYTKSFEEENETKGSNIGIIGAIILTILLGLISIWNLAVFIIVTPLGLLFSIMLGFVDLHIGVGIGIELMAIVIAVLVSKRA